MPERRDLGRGSETDSAAGAVPLDEADCSFEIEAGRRLEVELGRRISYF